MSLRAGSQVGETLTLASLGLAAASTGAATYSGRGVRSGGSIPPGGTGVDRQHLRPALDRHHANGLRMRNGWLGSIPRRGTLRELRGGGICETLAGPRWAELLDVGPSATVYGVLPVRVGLGGLPQDRADIDSAIAWVKEGDPS